MTDDLLAFLHQQFENQRFRGEALKTLAHALPPETGAYLTETGELLLAEVDAKRRILDRWQDLTDEVRDAEARNDPDAAPVATEYAYEQVARALALPYADRAAYRPEWAPDAG